MQNTKRKGARATKDIPLSILEQLNRGELETANLVEWLAIDQKLLLGHLLKEWARMEYLSPVLKSIDALKKQTVNTLNEVIGTGLLQQAVLHKDPELFRLLASHPSDMPRCWATYAVGRNEKLTLKEKLQQIRPFAADGHFGVREISWLALRSSISGSLMESIAILAKWTSEKEEGLRRFASESTRPRGVWCPHIEALKQDPGLCLPILEPLRADPSRYVQDSVGNWLNDAAKSQPGFVETLCKKWSKESKSKETTYIVKKALRSLT